MQEVPKEFFQTLTHEDMMEIINNDSCLPPRLELRLYRMLDIQRKPTGDVQLLMKKAEVERLVREIKRDQSTP
jgi:hypothetical protein